MKSIQPNHWFIIAVFGLMFILMSCSTDDVTTPTKPDADAQLERELKQCVLEYRMNQAAKGNLNSPPPPPGVDLCDCVTRTTLK